MIIIGRNLTLYEFAELRLATWKALDGWGNRVEEEIEIGTNSDGSPKIRKIKSINPWGITRRQEEADSLLQWLLSPFDLTEAEPDGSTNDGDGNESETESKSTTETESTTETKSPNSS
jgi:hypothetical protein